MLTYIVRRLVLFVPMAAGMVIVTFSLLLLIPGDPAAVLLGQEASPDDIAQLRATLGLDQPWYVRLGRYFAGLLQGDLGARSSRTSPCPTSSLGALGATVELAVAALSSRSSSASLWASSRRCGRARSSTRRDASCAAWRLDAGLLARHPADAGFCRSAWVAAAIGRGEPLMDRLRHGADRPARRAPRLPLPSLAAGARARR